MAGRRPKPTHLKLIEGNPGKRKLNENEPTPPPGIPKCPSWLSAKAKHAWRYIAPLLDGMGVVTVADKMAIELMCDAYSEYRDARDTVRREGAYYETESGNGSTMKRLHPAVNHSADAWRRVRLMAIEYGLTAAARSKLSVTPEKTDDLEELIGYDTN